MQLHDAVGIYCEKAQLLRIKAQMSNVWAHRSMFFHDCVCVVSDLTRHDYLSLVEGESRGLLLIK